MNDNAAHPSSATLARVVAIAQDIVPQGVVVTTTSCFETLQFDSLDCIVFTTEIEDAFGVEISCMERLDFDTLAQVAAMIDERIAPLALAA